MVGLGRFCGNNRKKGEIEDYCQIAGIAYREQAVLYRAKDQLSAGGFCTGNQPL